MPLYHTIPALYLFSFSIQSSPNRRKGLPRFAFSRVPFPSTLGVEFLSSNPPSRYVTMQTLLRASLPHIAQCGFTRAAVVAGTPEVSEMTLSALFPGQDKAETSLPRRLFRFWDETHAPSARAETFDGAVAKLEERLAHSWDVRHHLLPVSPMQSFTYDLAWRGG